MKQATGCNCLSSTNFQSSSHSSWIWSLQDKYGKDRLIITAPDYVSVFAGKFKAIFAIILNICRGCNLLRPCSEAKDCQLYNDEFTQPRNKTLKMFLQVLCSHLFRYLIFNIIQQKCRFSKYVFLLQGATGNSRLKVWACDKQALLDTLSL